MKIIGIGILGFLTASVAGAAMPVDINAYIGRRDDAKHLLEVVVGTCNTTSVNASLTRIDSNAWLRSPKANAKLTTIGAPVKSWVLDMKLRATKMNKNQQDRFYSRTVALPWLDPGLYLLKLTKGSAKSQLLINLSRMDVVFKQSRTKGLVWVTDRENGAVLPNAQVTFFNSKGAKVGGGKTDREGVLFTKLKPVNVQVLVTKGQDANGVRSSYFSTDGNLDVHFQTDRPVYRPGQAIYYKAILRRKSGQVYRNLPNTKVEVELHDESSNVVDQVELTSNAMGSVVGSFDIPSEAAVGYSTIVVKVGKEQSEDYVQVEAYRKPEFQVDAICTAKRLFAGEKGAFRVNASYYFGSPLAQAKVKYTIRKQNQSVWGSNPSDEEEGYEYGEDFPNGYRRYGAQDIANGTVYTDKKGVVTIPFNTAKDSKDSTYSITCQAFDSSNREVFAEDSVPVYASSIRVGIKSTVSYAPLGALFPVQIDTHDIDGKPVSAGVTLKMKDVVYNAKTKTWSPRVLLTTYATTDAKGNVTVNLPAKAEGYLTLIASTVDKNGRQTTSSMTFWVAGPGANLVTMR
jgi:uncharacterized protein YfaS (alpha-2-macroglobulin family)